MKDRKINLLHQIVIRFLESISNRSQSFSNDILTPIEIPPHSDNLMNLSSWIDSIVISTVSFADNFSHLNGMKKIKDCSVSVAMSSLLNSHFWGHKKAPTHICCRRDCVPTANMNKCYLLTIPFWCCASSVCVVAELCGRAMCGKKEKAHIVTNVSYYILSLVSSNLLVPTKSLNFLDLVRSYNCFTLLI